MTYDDIYGYKFQEREVLPGQHSMDVYDATLSWWRAAIRRKLVKAVERESEMIATMQKRIRTPWLDTYFVYTSSLGTHTFFMILLPTFFFFGHDEVGRGLLMVLALGVYCSSVLKDLICSPRPFAPPVTRLTIGSHHLEYGFPSTHSTNSVSIALFFFGYVHTMASSGTISPQTYAILTVILSIYTLSIVFGRIYTAMHSFTDCIMGIILGAGIWWGHTSWSGISVVLASSNPLFWLSSALRVSTRIDSTHAVIYVGKGLGAGKWLDSWVLRGGWEVPIILIPIGLFLVHQHPQPVDDCPCFEDAIAFMSVVLGSLVGRWGVEYSGVGALMGRTIVMPGSGWLLDAGGQWIQLERGWSDVCLWWGVAALKMVVGILAIFAWRLFAKSALHLILPPTYRLLARAFRLPHRRFYTPATEYKNVPSEFHVAGPGGGFGLHPIPSVIDLPATGDIGFEVGGIGSGVDINGPGNDFKKIRSVHGSAVSSEKGGFVNVNGVDKDEEDEKVKHYDADVLTKVIVYAGIAVLASEVAPVMFEILGLGVKSWV